MKKIIFKRDIVQNDIHLTFDGFKKEDSNDNVMEALSNGSIIYKMDTGEKVIISRTPNSFMIEVEGLVPEMDNNV